MLFEPITGRVASVSASAKHDFSKATAQHIDLLAGLGVEGDAHCGATVKHRSRVAKNPHQPNLRQVHLIHAELFTELAGRGHAVQHGQMGENITTSGIDLLALPTDTTLFIGAQAAIRLTGLRNPCWQIDHFQAGLMSAVLDRDASGVLIRKAGVMAVVIASGRVAVGDVIRIEFPATPHHAMEPV